MIGRGVWILLAAGALAFSCGGKTELGGTAGRGSTGGSGGSGGSGGTGGISSGGAGGISSGGRGNRPQRCTLPPVRGNCEALHKKYYFDTGSGRCREFTYGGCGGNSNRFDTLDECRRICGR